MASLWFEELPGDWAIRALSAPADVLAPDSTSPAGAPFLAYSDAPAARGWHLLAPPHREVWLNGLPVLAGVRTLCDRDEIRTDAGDTFFFSTEELAAVTALPAGDATIMCPRCRQQVETGTSAVRCPQCNLWHHQSDTLPCWTYAPTCAMCPQPSALDAGFQWTPTEL